MFSRDKMAASIIIYTKNLPAIIYFTRFIIFLRVDTFLTLIIIYDNMHFVAHTRFHIIVSNMNHVQEDRMTHIWDPGAEWLSD